MKNKDYTNLVKSENGVMELNKFCTLERWTDSFGQKVDMLQITISIVGHADYQAYINSRDAEGIKAEVQEHITKAFAKVSEMLCTRIANNYN